MRGALWVTAGSQKSTTSIFAYWLGADASVERVVILVADKTTSSIEACRIAEIMFQFALVKGDDGVVVGECAG